MTVREEESELRIFTADMEPLCRHPLSSGRGLLLQNPNHLRDRSVGVGKLHAQLETRLEHRADEFLRSVREEKLRYVRDRFLMLQTLPERYGLEKLLNAIAFCQKLRLFSFNTVRDYLEYHEKQSAPPPPPVKLPPSAVVYHVTTRKRPLEDYAKVGGDMSANLEQIRNLSCNLHLACVDFDALFQGRDTLTPLESVELFLPEQQRLRTEMQNLIRRKRANLPWIKTPDSFDFVLNDGNLETPDGNSVGLVSMIREEDGYKVRAISTKGGIIPRKAEQFHEKRNNSTKGGIIYPDDVRQYEEGGKCSDRFIPNNGYILSSVSVNGAPVNAENGVWLCSISEPSSESTL